MLRRLVEERFATGGCVSRAIGFDNEKYLEEQSQAIVERARRIGASFISSSVEAYV
jgi:hypothetical protein